MCFLDCVLKFDDAGTIVEDNATLQPRHCRYYQFFEFELLDVDETEEEKTEATEELIRFLSSTWHGNIGAHNAEMMAITLAHAGGEFGRFFALPGKSDVCKTTHDVVFSYFLGAADSIGGSSMGGTLHADWLCDERALGFERNRILSCKFTFTPEQSAKPILNDL